MSNYSRDDCFLKFKNLSTSREKLLEIALKNDDWTTETANDKYSFLNLKVDLSAFPEDTTLSIIAKNFSKIGRIFKMKSSTYYSLHRDGWRGVAVNMLLNDDMDSITFFETGSFRRNQIHIETLSFQKNEYYLLNTQIRHAVVNPTQDRYMFSIGIGSIDPNNPPSDRLEKFNIYKKQFKDLGLIE